MKPLTMSDGRKVCLGRIRPKARPNVIRLGPYIKAAIPLPESVDYTPKAQAAIQQMYLNDQYGDCVIAGKCHGVGVWTGNEGGQPVIASNSEIWSAYQTICGPGDNGCSITNVLDVMKSRGLTFGGKAHKIDGYVAIDWTNRDEVKTAIILFGAVVLGINIPEAWVRSPDIWDITTTGIAGGHDVTCVGYNANGVIVSTWGSLRTVTWRAFTSQQWVEECYAMLSPDWYSAGKAPSGFDAAQLRDDLAKLSSGTIPPIDPTPGPSPTPDPTPTPLGLTLDQAIEAIVNGIENGRPYGIVNTVGRVEQAAIAALRAAWPSGH